MKPSRSVHNAVAAYLNREWDFGQLQSWAFEYGDDPVRREDDWSMGHAMDILAWTFEIGDGFRSIDEFDADLRALLHTSAAAD